MRSPRPAENRASEYGPLIERLGDEMARRWRAGEQPLIEEYLARHTELAEHPEAALELIAEEIYLRAEAGQDLDPAEFGRRFPQWRRQVQALLECHQLITTQIGPPRFPASGETLDDFRLLAELGRGAHGRVFLARQAALADRPVVLKLAPGSAREHLSLSRLQHTHIVPLYSVHDFPERGLRGLCQPYFGGASLADLLRVLEPIPPGERTGLDLLRALQRPPLANPKLETQNPKQIPNPNGGNPKPPSAGVSDFGSSEFGFVSDFGFRISDLVPVKGPACQFLARATYPQAACWMGACLADALHYAHERGLLHLDLKPSNVLLAADGQPMLLDFHLAHPPLAAGATAPFGLGGTPGYMAPEHQAALTAATERRDVPRAVESRADVYALGVLLYGALGGIVPVPAERPAQQLRRRNPGVTVGLADLLSRCLAADPAARYPSAGDLAADLRRHLANHPLQGVANRSPAERWRKWRRRRPHALWPLVLLLLSAVAAGLLGAHYILETRAAETVLHQGQDHLRQHHYDEARDAFRYGTALLSDLPFGVALRQQLQDGIEQAERGQAAGELHQLCERLRPLYGADFLPADQARAVVDHCQALWQKRDLIAHHLASHPASDSDSIQADLLDLAILWANLRVRLAPPNETPAAHQEALAVLAQAEALFGPSCVLCQERRIHALALGQTDVATAAAQQGATLAPRSAWEYFALGRASLQAGDLAQAAAQLDRAVQLQPQGLWPHFYHGLCAYRLGQYQDALVDFAGCVVLAPGSAACYYNRGRAYGALGRLERAQQDYDRALQLDPALKAAAAALAEIRDSRPLQKTEAAHPRPPG
jgi:tetratricopeptide (TPR) repeat protein